MPTSLLVGLNRYAYAGNNPTYYTDTTGLSFWSDVKDLFGAMKDDLWDRPTAAVGGWVEHRLGLSGQEWYEDWGRDFA